MNKVTLQGVEYNLPCHVISLGLDMQCHHVVTQSTILSINSEKFVIKSEGIKIQLPISDLDDFYIDNYKNRKTLRHQCVRELEEWKEAVNKEWESKGLKKPFNNED